MIEISLGKMVLLALIALIVLGPEKLPGAARTAGALLRRVRSGWDNVRAEVERELEIEEIKRNAREAAAQAEAAQNALKDTVGQAREPMAEAALMMKGAVAEARRIEPAQLDAAQAAAIRTPGGAAAGRACEGLPDQGHVAWRRLKATTRSPTTCSRACSRICLNCVRACSRRSRPWWWCCWRWCRSRIVFTPSWPRRWSRAFRTART